MTQRNGEARMRGISRPVLLALRFRPATLVLFLAVTVFLSLQLGRIEMSQDPSVSMIPPGHGFFPALQAIEEMSTQNEALIGILEVHHGDVYNQETVQKVERITQKLLPVQEFFPRMIVSLAAGINHYENTVEGLVGEPILGRIPPETEEDFQALKRRVAVNPLGLGTFVSYDGTATLITAGIVDLETKADTSYGQLSDEERARLSLEAYKKQKLEGFHQNLLGIVRELKAGEEDENHTLHFTGDRLLAAQVTSMARSQVPLAAAAMGLLVVLLLAVHFRSLAGTLVPVCAFVFSVVWGLGIFGIGKPLLNPMAFLFPLMLGTFSLVASAMVMDEYQRTTRRSEDKLQAIAAPYRRAPVAACFLAALFLSVVLLAAGVPMIRQLGWFGFCWAAGTFVVVGVACPALMSLLPGPAKGGAARRGRLGQSLAERLARPPQGKGRVMTVILLVLILAAGGFSARRLEVGDNVPGASYVRSSHPWNRGFDVMAEKFNGPYLLQAHVEAKEEGGLLHPEAINEMGDFSAYLEAEGGARQSVAFDTIVKLGRMALMDGNPKWWTVPASREDVEGLSRLLTFSGELAVLVDSSFSQATIASFFPQSRADRIDGYVALMQSYIDSHPSDHMEFGLGGGLLGKTKAINDGTRDAYRKTVALALVTVFLVGLFVARSVRLSLIVTLAVAAAQALVWVILAALGRAVSLAAVPAAGIGLGLGALLGFYLLRQIAAEGSESVDPGDPARSGWGGRAGGGVFFLGALAFAAMLPWFFIGLKFQADMALVFGMTALVQTISVVMFVPALARGFPPNPGGYRSLARRPAP